MPAPTPSMKMAERRALRPDAQAFDEVRIVTVPRYKQSGLSGDEWRISASIQLFRKGKLIHERSVRNVETACGFAYVTYLEAIDAGEGFFAGDGHTCDQEGCSTEAVVTYRLKSQFCHDGHAFSPNAYSDEPLLRKFCDQHKTRGDCGFEDADSNYELVALRGAVQEPPQ